MQITKIEFQKKNKQRVNLYVDDEFYCGLSVETTMKNHLKEGQIVVKDELDKLILQTEKETALSKAVGYISKSQKTESEIKKYLIKKGFDEASIDFTITKLKEYHYIDDALYAKNYIKFKGKSNGSKKLESELRQKGVEKDIAKMSIDEYANDRESILKVATKYLKNKEKDLRTKQKACRFLASKGYNFDDINYILNKILKEVEEDESWD